MAGSSQTPATFDGTYEANGATVTIQQVGTQVTGTIVIGNQSGTLGGIVNGGLMQGSYTVAGKSGTLVAQLAGDQLSIAADGGQPITMIRQHRQDNAATPMVATAPSGPAVPTVSRTGSTGKPPPAPGRSAARGAPYRDELDGWEVKTPDRWQPSVHGGKLVFASHTEAGMIVVTFLANATYEQAVASVETIVQQTGGRMLGAIREHEFRAGKGIVVETTGVGGDGVEINARGITVAGPRGLLSIVGITTPQKLAGLRKRVDAVAQSARFYTPRRTPAMTALVGPWWHYSSNSSGNYYTDSSSSSASWERTLELCADGSFFDSSQSNISVSAKDDYRRTGADRVAEGAGQGRWNAQGDDTRGTLRLQFHDGTVQQYTYVFKKRGGGDIELDGRWFGRSPDSGGKCR